MQDVMMAARQARLADAPAITAIYNQGIEDRVGTFETEPRTVADIEAWFAHAKAFVAVTDEAAGVVGYAVAHPYADRSCYAGIGAFSVYVRRDQRGCGVGRALDRLVHVAADDVRHVRQTRGEILGGLADQESALDAREQVAQAVDPAVLGPAARDPEHALITG